MGITDGIGKPYVIFSFFSFTHITWFCHGAGNKVELETTMVDEMQSQGEYGGIHRLKKYYDKIPIRCVHMEWSNFVINKCNVLDKDIKRCCSNVRRCS